MVDICCCMVDVKFLKQDRSRNLKINRGNKNLNEESNGIVWHILRLLFDKKNSVFTISYMLPPRNFNSLSKCCLTEMLQPEISTSHITTFESKCVEDDTILFGKPK